MIPINRPILPPFEQYVDMLRGIWDRGRLTNGGPLLAELEQRLAEYLGVPHVVMVTNGTLALQLAIRAADLDGDVLTTPFSYVATTGALVWERCRPVFVDIEPETMTIDPTKLAAQLTPRTQAILATHVYGFPCYVEEIARFAADHGLVVIYDAAHAFGATWNGRSLVAQGDLATLSFHATKLFHTVEGGAIVTRDDALAARLLKLRNFGQIGPDQVVELGINAKASEFQGAMGLCLLPVVSELIAQRGAVAARYDTLVDGTTWLTRPRARPGSEPNHAYYPVVFDTEARLERTQAALRARGIETRRYFYPSLNRLPYVDRGAVPVSESIAPRVLCLPLYAQLTPADAETVARALIEEGNRP